MYLQAQNLHLSWLKSRSEDLRTQAETHYANATKMMSSCVVKTLVTFHMAALVVGCTILVQVCMSLSPTLKLYIVFLSYINSFMNFFRLYFVCIFLVLSNIMDS